MAPSLIVHRNSDRAWRSCLALIAAHFDGITRSCTFAGILYFFQLPLFEEGPETYVFPWFLNFLDLYFFSANGYGTRKMAPEVLRRPSEGSRRRSEGLPTRSEGFRWLSERLQTTPRAPLDAPGMLLERSQAVLGRF